MFRRPPPLSHSDSIEGSQNHISAVEKIERPPHLAPHSSSPQFQVVIDLYECLRDEKKLEKRRGFLDTWFKKWRKNVGPDTYPAMCLILPQKDRERASYGLKEYSLGKGFIAALGLNEKSSDAQKIMKWKEPTTKDKNAAPVGDFSTILFEVISRRSSVIEGNLTVDGLNDLLDQLSQDKQKEKHAKIIGHLVDKCSPNEIRWIVRIILKDMVIHVKENTVLSVFHRDAIDLFNTCSDLKRVCYDLADPEHRLRASDKEVGLFQPFQPMLCKRPKGIPSAVKLMGGKPFHMEEKLDGERMQLHKRGNQYFYCSRKAKEYTYMYGNDVGSGTLTPYLHQQAFHTSVVDVILDGEMLVWDPTIEKYLPFGSLKTAALGAASQDHKPRPCFKVFDLLYLTLAKHSDGEKTTIFRNVPLKNRKKTLRDFGLFTEIKGRFEFALEREGTTASDVEEYLQEIVETRGEGLVLKLPSSPYLFGGRDNSWVKVKPEYMDTIGDTIDVIVLAATWGKGRRAGKLSSLICGVRDDMGKTGGGVTRYLTFVRVGTGLSFADYEWINKQKWIVYDPQNPPAWIVASNNPTPDDKGDVYLNPADSFIITIKAASINNSEMYGANMTMRFPRCKGIRYDLTPAECMPFSEILAIQSGKKRKNEGGPPELPKKKKGTRKQTIILAESHRGANVKDLQVKTDLFNGIKFMVISEPSSKPRYTKEMLEKTIFEHGGDFCQVLRGQSDVIPVYGGTAKIPQVANIIRRDDLDIVRPEWIFDSIKANDLVLLKKKYFFYATESREETADYDLSSSEDIVEDDIEEDDAANAVEVEHSSQVVSAPQGSLPEWLQPEGGTAPPEISSGWSEADPDSTDTDSEPELVERENKLGRSRSSAGDEDEDSSYHFVEEGTPVSVEPLQSSFNLGSVKTSLADSFVLPEPERVVLPTNQDLEGIFSRLCFYLDTPENARKNRMDAPTREPPKAVFQETERKIIRSGGQTTSDLSNPHLTHVVVDESDLSRRVELIRRTARPKRHRLVVPNFITLCIQEDTLLDEDAFAP